MHLVSGQPLIIRLTHLKNVKMLDLSSNRIVELFKKGAEIPHGILDHIVSLNLSDNPITDIKQTCEQIRVMMPHLNDL